MVFLYACTPWQYPCSTTLKIRENLICSTALSSIDIAHTVHRRPSSSQCMVFVKAD
ncbi:hypothetical protein Plhal304r1_c070g0158771 [Plasmopara halstedii]